MTPSLRESHERWLVELTAIPTAAGREARVIAWVESWAAGRAGVDLSRDPSGNLSLARRGAKGPVVYITAHLDHPAFVVERVLSPGALELSFRGGVMDDYFSGARVRVHPAEGAPAQGSVAQASPAPASQFKHWIVELDAPAPAVKPGDVAVWDLPPSEVREGLLYAPACDDLAGLAAGLAAFDALLLDTPMQDVRLLLTRAEEIGFIGAIGACRHGTMPGDARVLALETSRSFADSPIGGGPIVRVGDRLSTFSPNLTAAVAKRAEEIAGAPAQPLATQKAGGGGWKWQRKLMAGGACEATVFCAAGYESTCLCLPLGNYHNMGNLEAMQAGTGSPVIAPEVISISDFHGLVDLLVACGRSLPTAPTVQARLDKLWADKSFVLD